MYTQNCINVRRDRVCVHCYSHCTFCHKSALYRTSLDNDGDKYAHIRSNVDNLVVDIQLIKHCENKNATSNFNILSVELF